MDWQNIYLSWEMKTRNQATPFLDILKKENIEK